MSDPTIAKTDKQFAEMASELLDHEIQAAMQIVVGIQRRYANRRNTVENLEEMRDEVLTRLSEKSILATFDPTPCFHGEPPILEFIGKINTDPIHKHGYDHEQKTYEVRKATDRGEDFLGQKERVNARVPKAKKSSE